MKIRMAMVAGRDVSAFEKLADLLRPAGLVLEPAFVPSYAAMYGVLEHRVCMLGWAPPLVAADLLRGRDAEPVALVARHGSPTYWSALVTRAESRLWHVGQVARARIGWVSRLSAAGYVVPRAHLSMARVSLAAAKESFHHTHARVVDALLEDAVDVVATYGIGRDGSICVPHVRDARILGAMGPIPGELLVGDPIVADLAKGALAGASFDGIRFLEPPVDYLQSIDNVFARGRVSSDLACAKSFDSGRTAAQSGPELEQDSVTQSRAWG